MAFDMKLYDRQVGVFGVEACVPPGVPLSAGTSALTLFDLPPSLYMLMVFYSHSMGKLIQMDVLLIGLRGLGVETGEPLPAAHHAHAISLATLRLTPSRSPSDDPNGFPSAPTRAWSFCNYHE